MTYTEMYELFQSLASDADETNLAFAKILIQQGQNKVNSRLKVNSREKTKNYTLQTDAITGTSNRAYYLPNDFYRLVDLYETVDNHTYHARPIYNERMWRQMNSGNTSTSDILQYYFIRGNRLEIFPLPSTTRVMTLVYKQNEKLLFDNYTAGTITTLAANGTTVTGDSTVWTSALEGRMFKINDNGEWYEVVKVNSATSIDLVSGYKGAAIAAGTSAYSIGQMPPTPPTTHILPVYFALWHYYMMQKETYQNAQQFKSMFIDGLNEAQEDFNSFDDDQIVDNELDAQRRRFVNPNWYPENLS